MMKCSRLPHSMLEFFSQIRSRDKAVLGYTIAPNSDLGVCVVLCLSAEKFPLPNNESLGANLECSKLCAEPIIRPEDRLMVQKRSC